MKQTNYVGFAVAGAVGALVALAIVSLVKAPQKTDVPTPSATLGWNITYTKDGCQFVTIAANESDEVIAKIPLGTVNSHAYLEGNFAGMGVRTLRNPADGTTILADIVYHPRDYQDALAELDRRCNTYP